MSYVYFSISELGLCKSKYTNIYLGSKEILTFLYMLQNVTHYEIHATDKWCLFPNCCFS